MENRAEPAARLVFCACPSGQHARKIAQALVEARLAACVSELGPMASTFRWEGEISREQETLLLIKTTAGAVAAVTERLRALHPYELPEIIAVPVTEGLPAYLKWVAGEVSTME